jgi:hypothetical protein
VHSADAVAVMQPDTGRSPARVNAEGGEQMYKVILNTEFQNIEDALKMAKNLSYTAAGTFSIMEMGVEPIIEFTGGVESDLI